MNQINISILKKTRSMCLLYGIICMLGGLISFAILDQDLIGSILVVVSILGFWRVSHKIKLVLKAEDPRFFKDYERNKDSHGR